MIVITSAETACSEYKLKYQDDIADFEKEFEGENRKFVGCAINTQTSKLACSYAFVLVA